MSSGTLCECSNMCETQYSRSAEGTSFYSAFVQQQRTKIHRHYVNWIECLCTRLDIWRLDITFCFSFQIAYSMIRSLQKAHLFLFISLLYYICTLEPYNDWCFDMCARFCFISLYLMVLLDITQLFICFLHPVIHHR